MSNGTTWVEVSTGALERNYAATAAFAKVPICAVVKANAYGHGLAETARVFERSGARWLAVTRVEEARVLRATGLTARILVLTPPPSQSLIAEAVTLGCSITLSDVSDVERFAAAARHTGKPAAVHIKVDTGMGRLGVTVEQAPSVAASIAASDDLVLEGVFTHFADAAGPSGALQLARFNEARAALGKHTARVIVHASNSAALLALPGARFDMVRAGTLLYGQSPPGAAAPFPLEPTFRWLAALVAVRDLPAGATVGYGGEHTAKRRERTGTLAVGWGDGFTAEPSTRTPSLGDAMVKTARSLAAAAKARPDPRTVYFGDAPARVLGRVGMQAITVSLDRVHGATVGDVARIPGRRLLVNPLIERVYLP